MAIQITNVTVGGQPQGPGNAQARTSDTISIDGSVQGPGAFITGIVMRRYTGNGIPSETNALLPEQRAFQQTLFGQIQEIAVPKTRAKSYLWTVDIGQLGKG